MDDDSVTRHLQRLRNADYPPEDSQRTIALIFDYGNGGFAESALDEIVQHLPDNSLNHLIDRYINPYRLDLPGLEVQDWINEEGVFGGYLSRFGIQTVDGPDGWVLTLPDGTTLTQQYRGVHDPLPWPDDGLPDRGHALAPIALAAVWRTIMRSRPCDTSELSAY